MSGITLDRALNAFCRQCFRPRPRHCDARSARRFDRAITLQCPLHGSSVTVRWPQAKQAARIARTHGIERRYAPPSPFLALNRIDAYSSTRPSDDPNIGAS